jgi:hypothetical protein
VVDTPPPSPSILHDLSAWAAIVINFLFNIFNYRRTNAVRNATLELEEFKRLRTAADAALSKMREGKSELRSLEGSGSTVKKLREDVAQCNRSVSAAYSSLCDALSDMDRSSMINGSDWSDCINTPWDDFCSAIDATYASQKDLAETKKAINRAVDKLDGVIKCVQQRMDGELRRHRA